MRASSGVDREACFGQHHGIVIKISCVPLMRHKKKSSIESAQLALRRWEEKL
jgi:hypothetical protein